MRLCAELRSPSANSPRRALAAVMALLTIVAVPALVLAAEANETYNLRADNQEYVEDKLWRGTGHVQVSYQDVKIQCDELEMELATGDLTARGNVVLDQGPRRLTAVEVRYNMRSKTGIFIDATGAAPPDYYFTGAEVEKVDATHYRLSDATFSSCEPETRPPWQFHARRATLEEEGYGRFWGTSLIVKGVPALYVPYILWPIKQERAPGMMVPTLGYSGRHGAYLGNALYLPLGRSYDTTVLLDYYSHGDVGLGSEWRWAPVTGAEGDFTFYTIRDTGTVSPYGNPIDIGNQHFQWKVNGHHKQEDLLGFRMLAEVHELSDIDFFQEFERSFDRNTLRSLYSFVYLTRSWGPAALNLRADRRRTFITSAQDIILSQLPEAEVRVRPTRVGRTSLYWSLISSLAYFSVDRGAPLKGSYGRADAFPSVSYTLPGPPWLTVTPRVGGRATYYTKGYGRDDQGHTILVDQSIDRTYLEGGVDIVGPSFSRVFQLEHGNMERLKHLIEPRFTYTYLSDIDDRVSIPIFDEVDSVLVSNRMRVSLANRLFGRLRTGKISRELGSLELYQDYSFSQPLTTGSLGTSQRGGLNARLRVTPVTALNMDATASFDPLTDGLRSTSLSTALSGGVGYTNLTWYQGFRPDTGERSSSQVRAAFGLRKAGFPLQADLQLSYDIEQREFQQQHLKILYKGSCWGVEVEYRDLRIGAYPTRDYRISIDFKGIGRILEIQGGLGSINE